MINFLKQLFNSSSRSYTEEPVRAFSAMEVEDIKKHLAESRKSTQEIRKLTEQLTEAKHFTDSVILAAPCLIYTYDLVNKKNLWTNEKIYDFIGYTKKEIEEMGEYLLAGLQHPDDFKNYIEVILPRYYQLEDDEVSEHVIRYRHKTSDKWIYLKAREVVFERNSDGLPVKILGVTTDITKEFELIKELKLKSQALDTAANGIFITDLNGKIIFANQAFLGQMEYSIEEIIGQNPNMFKSGLHTREEYKTIWDTILSGKVWDGTITNKTKSGKLITHHSTITPIRNGVINYFIAIKEQV